MLLLAACAYYVLARALVALNGKDSVIAAALGSDVKGKSSIAIYVVAIAGSFLSPWLACALYVVVAVMWLIPDRRIEKALEQRRG